MRVKTLDELAANFAALNASLHGDLEYDGVSMSIEARNLDHMAEILTDTLPNDDPQRCYPVLVDGIGRVAFTCTGTYFEIL